MFLKQFHWPIRFVLLDKGQVQQVGTPKEILFQPASRFVKEFFNAQRLRLEMQVVLLSEVYDLLASTSDDRRYLVRIPLEKSIWEASEIIEREEQPAVVVGKSEKSLKVITPLALMEAFYQFKAKKNYSLSRVISFRTKGSEIFILLSLPERSRITTPICILSLRRSGLKTRD